MRNILQIFSSIPYHNALYAVISIMVCICLLDDDFRDSQQVELSQEVIEQIATVVTEASYEAVSNIFNNRKRLHDDIVESMEHDDCSHASITDGQEVVQRRKVAKYNWDRARCAIYDDYTGPLPLFKDRQFERIFRVNRSIMEEILNITGNLDDFFTERFNAVTNQPTISPTVKVLCGLKLLAFGVSPIAFIDYFQMSENTARDCMKRLAACIVQSVDLRECFF